MSDLQQWEEQRARWRADPVRFVIEVFNVVPDYWQCEALTHLADRPGGPNALKDIYRRIRASYATERKYKGSRGEIGEWNWTESKKWTDVEWVKNDHARPFRRVSAASGHGCGKSSVMAWTVLWLHICFFPLKTGATAPTAPQLEDVLWAELSKWHQKMPKWLQQQLTIGDLRVELVGQERRSFTTGRTARREQPEALQGLHEENTGVVVDECSGVPDVVFESSEGIMTSPSTRALLCSNPTRLDGFFYQTHTKLPNWYTITVSGEHNPRVGREFVEQIATRYGRDSNGFRIRVQGLFPRSGDDAIIPYYLVEDAMSRDVEPYPDAAVVWGLDVARFGSDRTALSKRRGNVKLGPTLFWSQQDTMQTVGRIIREYEDCPFNDRPDDIVVDTIGLGAGVLDRLREAGMPVTECAVSVSAIDGGGFNRLRDELWWACRQWLERGDSKLPGEEQDPPTERTVGAKLFAKELTTPKYKVLSNGKIVVESKSDVKKRMPTAEKQSPDGADSFILTFASTRGRVQRHARKIPYRSINPLARAS